MVVSGAFVRFRLDDKLKFVDCRIEMVVVGFVVRRVGLARVRK